LAVAATVVEIVSDDMPFLVDSVSMEVGRHGYGIHLLIHPVINVHRDEDGELVEVAPPGGRRANGRVGHARRARSQRGRGGEPAAGVAR
jgi:NAD-specific glutamate dehydrogenase